MTPPAASRPLGRSRSAAHCRRGSWPAPRHGRGALPADGQGRAFGAAPGPSRRPARRRSDRLGRGDGNLAGKRLLQLGLAIAGDAGDAEDLAGPEKGEADVAARSMPKGSGEAATGLPPADGPRRRRDAGRGSGRESSEPIIMPARLAAVSSRGVAGRRPPCRCGGWWRAGKGRGSRRACG